jgi:signal transduction histidine kinase
VRNLLDNALAHARSSVCLSLSCDDRVACLEVRDDGPGIPEEHRDRIFERFARVEPGRARLAAPDRAGTGLGLAIARSIARRHGGDVRVLETTVGARLAVQLAAAPTPATPASREPSRF